MQTRTQRPTTARPGFTLIELLIVVVVIGILASIAASRARRASEETYLVTVKSDIRRVATAQEMYHGMNLQYGTLAQLNDYLVSEGVTLVINWVDPTGYAVTATHAGLPATQVCGYFIGAAPAGSAGPATVEARIACN